MKLLLAEDEAKVAKALSVGLKREGFAVTVAHTGDEAFGLAMSEPFDLVVLDLGLPKRDGLDVLRELRNRGISVPVLILTARDSLDARVEGLSTGADDYLVKPFAFAELSARINALLRRTRHPQEGVLSAGDLVVNVIAHTAVRRGSEIPLTPREFHLLQYLLRHKDHIVSREMIARDVWKQSARATPLDNIIDVHIAHIRRKVDSPFERKLLHTVRGVGFILSENLPS